jgi:type VI secretion system protein VasD
MLKKAPPLPTTPPVTIAAPPEARAKASLTLTVGKDVNPNAEGRPSPVVVRVYQLKKQDAFMGAQFEPLYDDDKKALGDELVTTDQFRLAPGDAPRTIEVAFAPDTQFVGVLAAFRSVADPSTTWRVAVRVPRKALNVAVNGTRISVSASE